MTCPHCRYQWKERTQKPKKCPLCQKWINKPKAVAALLIGLTLTGTGCHRTQLQTSASFLIAGQSNGVSGYQTTERGISTTGRVTARDMASSFSGIPSTTNPSKYNIAFIDLGDMLSQVFNLDIEMVNVANGNTSSRDWIEQRLYERITKELSKHRYDAIFWVQGESDYLQHIDTTESYAHMKFIIEESKKVQPTIKWYVALDGWQGVWARETQERLIREGLAYRGPDIDTMRTDHPDWFEGNLAEFQTDAGFMGHAKAWFDALNTDQRWLNTHS